VWDHVVFAYGVPETADPWVLLTVIALATERIRLGPLVTPVARRPGTLARQATSVDRLSGGRLVFARRLDEGLEVLAGLWSGEQVNFRGEHVTVAGVTFAPTPTPTQRPRPPVWIGCDWPSRPPLRKAARWSSSIGSRPSTSRTPTTPNSTARSPGCKPETMRNTRR
jgi:alkanesulfonate monooxygenase SsuD/methylene tetrahydromethanopterin reductase-like flavin-dependent oxidoreductase (luciferase family)